MAMNSDDFPVFGLLGQIPLLADAIDRNVPQVFASRWLNWEKQGLSGMEGYFGSGWRDTLLTGPLWRYYLAPGLIGESGWIGVLTPSVDRNERPGFLGAMGRVPDGVGISDLVRDWDDGLDRMEWLVLSALDESMAVNDVIAALGHLADDFPMPHRQKGRGRIIDVPPARIDGKVWEFGGGLGIDAEVLRLSSIVSAAVDQNTGRFSLWWQSNRMRASQAALLARALPEGAGFGALSSQDWAALGAKPLSAPLSSDQVFPTLRASNG